WCNRYKARDKGTILKVDTLVLRMWALFDRRFV
ncbi:hypothetical protein PanWU01x14_338640, partial [Parasponia andersonii]